MTVYRFFCLTCTNNNSKRFYLMALYPPSLISFSFSIHQLSKNEKTVHRTHVSTLNALQQTLDASVVVSLSSGMVFKTKRVHAQPITSSSNKTTSIIKRQASTAQTKLSTKQCISSTLNKRIDFETCCLVLIEIE